MRHRTVRALTWVRSRARLRDDRGLETAEILMWMGVVAVIITALSVTLNGILADVVNEIQGVLNF